jgi:hypothetical protein
MVRDCRQVVVTAQGGIERNAIQLCGALEEVDLGWAVVGDVAVGGAFGSLVFQSAAFDGAGAAAMSTGRVESLDDFTDRGSASSAGRASAAIGDGVVHHPYRDLVAVDASPLASFDVAAPVRRRE